MLINLLVPTTEVLAFHFSGHMEADIMTNVADRPDFGEHCIYTINLWYSLSNSINDTYHDILHFLEIGYIQ